MTTIVATRTELIVDTLISADGAPFHTGKLYDIPKLGYVAFCGELGLGLRYVKHLQAGKGKILPLPENFFNGIEPKDVDTDIIIVNGKEIILLDRFWEPMVIDEPFYAAGSGASYALGAMHAGAAPMKAMEIAAQLDPFTGGPFHHYVV